jgi:hypothetical protein
MNGHASPRGNGLKLGVHVLLDLRPDVSQPFLTMSRRSTLWPTLPGVPADLGAGLYHGELASPRREPAPVAEVTEPAQHRHHRVVCALPGSPGQRAPFVLVRPESGPIYAVD